MKLIITKDEIRRQFNLPMAVEVEVDGAAIVPITPVQEGLSSHLLTNAAVVFGDITKAVYRHAGNLYDAGSYADNRKVNKIKAIKAMREAVSGLGLLEAKNIVERFIASI